MKKFKLKCGHFAYRVSVLEIMTTGGLGICDKCGKQHPVDYKTGYLVPVLNRWYCKECFVPFAKDAEFYEEDIWFEKDMMTRYEKQLERFME